MEGGNSGRQWKMSGKWSWWSEFPEILFIRKREAFSSHHHASPSCSPASCSSNYTPPPHLPPQWSGGSVIMSLSIQSLFSVIYSHPFSYSFPIMPIPINMHFWKIIINGDQYLHHHLINDEKRKEKQCRRRKEAAKKRRRRRRRPMAGEMWEEGESHSFLVSPCDESGEGRKPQGPHR